MTGACYRVWEVAWANPRSWHFFPVVTASTKAAAQNVIGPLADKERRAQWKTNGSGHEGRWETREAAAAMPWLCCVSELARTSQAGGGSSSASTPLQPSAPSPRLCLLPLQSQQDCGC